ncbi:MAG: hypothetical protein ACP5FH_03200 [Terracidiphilus sp.]
MSSIAATAVAATTASSDRSSAPSPRLVQAAHEFEGQMLEQLLKPLMQGDGIEGEDDDSTSGSNGALGQYATEALGRALSDHGGFGIADSIVRQLSSNGHQQGSTNVIGNQHGNTVIKPHE